MSGERVDLPPGSRTRVWLDTGPDGDPTADSDSFVVRVDNRDYLAAEKAGINRERSLVLFATYAAWNAARRQRLYKGSVTEWQRAYTGSRTLDPDPDDEDGAPVDPTDPASSGI